MNICMYECSLEMVKKGLHVVKGASESCDIKKGLHSGTHQWRIGVALVRG